MRIAQEFTPLTRPNSTIRDKVAKLKGPQLEDWKIDTETALQALTGMVASLHVPPV